MEYIDIRITGEHEELRELLVILRKLQWCGDIGAGRTLPIYIDGDGSGRLSFDIKKDEKFVNIRDFVNLDSEKMKKVSDGDDFETHWIGE